MPEYEFEKPDGTIGLLYFSMAEAPRMGSKVAMNGEIWTRIPSRVRLSVEPEVRIEAMSCPVNDPDALKVGGSWNEHGEACFSSPKQRDEYAAMKGITYDR